MTDSAEEAKYPLVESLIDDAMQVLHHDIDDKDEVAIFERNQLRERFIPKLKKAGALK